MSLSALAMSLLLAGATPQTLDNDGLTTAISAAGTTPDNHGEALAGRRFRITLPVIYGDAQNLRTYKSPARWRYDRRKQELEISVGLGQISAQNYDQFDEQGLSKVPDLQTTYFHVEERKVPSTFTSRGAIPTDILVEAGSRSAGVSYGLATPYPRSGEVGLPSGFKPLMISRIHMDPVGVKQAVSGMIMVIEGDITTLTDGGPLICGRFRGMLLAKNITGDNKNLLSDKQCFVTANIDRVSIYAGQTSGWKNPLLKRWTK
ncbi:hypothetical protein [Caulobacter sp. Root655]|uniref:hypothetical protein n=1 Tax=Caulobacter sp. Root655 TaxID=1736578 RepID=UPI000AEEAD34|nr:hypothetical protein [Caulobacter sp. Root655]